MQIQIERSGLIRPVLPADPDRQTAWRAARDINQIAEWAGVIPFYSYISSSQVFLQLSADGWRCRWCGERHSHWNPLTVRHIIRVGFFRSGHHEACNLQTLCTICARMHDLADYQQVLLLTPFERGPLLRTLRELNQRCGPVKAPPLADLLGISERTARHYLGRLERFSLVGRPAGPRSGWMVLQ